MVLLILGVILAVIAALAWGIAHLPPWWSPAHALGVCTGTHAQIVACKGYNLFSGILSDVSELTLIFSAVSMTLGLYLHHQCEQPGCLRPGHRHPEHGRPVCRRHFHHDLVPPGGSA